MEQTTPEAQASKKSKHICSDNILSVLRRFRFRNYPRTALEAHDGNKDTVVSKISSGQNERGDTRTRLGSHRKTSERLINDVYS